MKPRRQVKRSAYDGLYRRWDRMSADEVGMRHEDAVSDYEIWVCTGVFAKRAEAFK